MIYDPKLSFLFLKNWKTASSSIEYALAPVLSPDSIVTPLVDGIHLSSDSTHAARNHHFRLPLSPSYPDALQVSFWDHMSLTDLDHCLPAWKSAFLAYGVRNPWDCAVSLFEWNKVRWEGTHDFEKFLFTKDHSNVPRCTFNDHWTPPTFPLRFENLHLDLIDLFACLEIPLPASFPYLKPRVSPRPHYSTYYLSPYWRKRVADLNAPIIDTYEYKFSFGDL